MRERFKERIKQERESWGLTEEVRTIEDMIKLYRSGKISDEEFRRFRLQHGAYGARLNPDYTMIRIKIPAGILFPDQLRKLANLSEAFSIGSVHVSTRQNIQVHWVYLDDVPEVERSLVEVGLTTREACGNTVRNVVASPFASVCKNEPFDVTPYAKAVAKFFLRNPMCQNLPRKFKFNFACCEEHNLARIADIGLVPTIKEANGKKIRGFRVYLGGGLGPASFIGHLLEEFTSEDQLLPTAMAVIRLFDRLGDRVHMHKNRMRYLVHELGFDKFKELVLQERIIVNATKSVKVKLDIKENAKPEQAPITNIKLHNTPEGFDRWFATNVMEQKQKGYSVVLVPLQMGDITATQLRALASISEEFSMENAIIATPRQGFALRWVLNSDLIKLYKKLSEAGLAKAGALTISAAVACTGTTSCNLAITNSHRLGKEVQRVLLEEKLDQDKDLEGATIHISGCPNSCGQHMIGTIGFYGGASRVSNSLAPTYTMLIGGRVGEDARLGHVLTRVPAKKVVDAILKLIEVYKSEKRDEKFVEWIDKVLEGKGYSIKDAKDLKKIIDEVTKMPSPEEDPELYMDYGNDSKFVAKTARGECAA